MKTSALVAQLGPSLLRHYVSQTCDTPEKRGDLLALLGPMLDQGIDTMQAQEHEGERIARARFVSHLAADIMRSWPGEPTQDAARHCVELARLIASESFRVCKEPF